jgi:hypothetical protein
MPTGVATQCICLDASCTARAVLRYFTGVPKGDETDEASLVDEDVLRPQIPDIDNTVRK